jgi:hypothetical protein
VYLKLQGHSTCTPSFFRTGSCLVMTSSIWLLSFVQSALLSRYCLVGGIILLHSPILILLPTQPASALSLSRRWSMRSCRHICHKTNTNRSINDPKRCPMDFGIEDVILDPSTCNCCRASYSSIGDMHEQKDDMCKTDDKLVSAT